MEVAEPSMDRHFGIKADTYVVVIVPDVYKHCIFIPFFLQ